MMQNPSNTSRLALFTSALTGGGVQSVTRNLALGLARMGHRVDLVVCHGRAEDTPDLAAAGVRVVVLEPAWPGQGRWMALRAASNNRRALLPSVVMPLKTWRKIAYLPDLLAYLRRERPQALLSAMTQCNLIAIWANALAGQPARVVVVEHNMLSSFVTRFSHKPRWRHLPALVAAIYPQAATIVTVSEAVADDLTATTGLDRRTIRALPNPVVDDRLRRTREQPPGHPWLKTPRPAPVILGVGRLVHQKDPVTLLRAFARLRARRPLRLLVLGNGPMQTELVELAAELGVADDIDWLGWIDDPAPFFAAADVFVLPSRWEGLPTVLIQALACGCPVVATDCPGGSGEILEGGRYGRLVPVADDQAMAAAIEATLDAPADRAVLSARAENYGLMRSASLYSALLTDEHIATGVTSP